MIMLAQWLETDDLVQVSLHFELDLPPCPLPQDAWIARGKLRSNLGSLENDDCILGVVVGGKNLLSYPTIPRKIISFCDKLGGNQHKMLSIPRHHKLHFKHQEMRVTTVHGRNPAPPGMYKPL